MTQILKPLLAFLVFCLQLIGSIALAQGDTANVHLPSPTGPSEVGTTVWHWVDGSRFDNLTPTPDDVREIMAQAWYPAELDSLTGSAPYAPLYPRLSNVKSWGYASAPLASSSEPLPVIILAPGRGVARHFYTAISEDLASHGFFVLGVDSPHSGRVVFPDGRVVAPNPRYRIPFEVLIGPYEHVDSFFQEAAELEAADIAFALDQLAAINRDDPANWFTGRLDLNRLGAFGHSLGGRIAGAAVASDQRFLAYASMEGVPPREPRRAGMDAAVMMMLSSELPDMAQPNIREIIPNRRNDVYIATLQGFGHNSVSDLPFVDPSEYDYEIQPLEGIETCRLLVRSFFDEYLRHRSGAMSEAATIDHVDLELFHGP